ncbi:MAG: hypothetical protein WC729_29600 [Sphingomonas sp.]|uniref:hypothetical protein n=1 Tax=Sphingomonas sp. TaxID=28214 RepID=UPI003567753D
MKHSNSKIVKAYYKNGGGNSRGSKIRVEVVTNRMAYASKPGKYKGYYEARACVRQVPVSRLRGRVGFNRPVKCGKLAWGYTPTAAVKKALHALAKSLK